MTQPQPLVNVDPTKIDLDLDIRDLSRQIIFTVKVNDDKLFTDLSKEANEFYTDFIAELNKIKQNWPKQTPQNP